MEISLSTTLLIFWAGDDVAALLERREKKDVLNIWVLASVMPLEICNGFAEILQSFT